MTVYKIASFEITDLVLIEVARGRASLPAGAE